MRELMKALRPHDGPRHGRTHPRQCRHVHHRLHGAPPEVHLRVGKLVDIGVHQLILDTPVWWALCDTYNEGRYKHHAPLIKRRRDGLRLRTANFLKSIGFAVDEDL